MSGYDWRNKCVFSFWRNVVSDGADWTSAGRLFQSRWPAAAKQRSPTMTYLLLIFTCLGLCIWSVFTADTDKTRQLCLVRVGGVN